MITHSAAQAAINLAEQIEAAGRRVVVVEGTPLASLLAVSCIHLQQELSPKIDPATGAVPVANSDAWTPNAQSISDESRMLSTLPNRSQSMSEHDELMDGITIDLSQSVAQYLTFAKNTVRPLIKDYVDQASAALAAYPEQSCFAPTIIKLDLPDVAMMPAIEHEIAKFKDVVYAPIAWALRLPSKTADEALALMQTGSAAVDGALTAWAQVVGVDTFSMVYNTVFAATAEGISPAYSPEQLFADKEKGKIALTAAFLMARNLLDNVPSDTPYTLADYRMAVGEMVEQLGQRLSKAFEDRQLHLTQESLIISWNGKDTVCVFAPVFDKWVEEGGITAVLYGNLLLDRPNLNLAGMLEDQEKCMRAWEQHNRFLTVTLQNKKHEAAIDTLKFVAEDLLAKNLQTIFSEEVVEEVVTLTNTQVADCLEQAKLYIGMLDAESIKDLWAVGLEVVAGIFFSYSAAATILRAMQTVAKDNPGIDPNEAALLATIDYVCNYVVDQVELREL